MITLWHDLRFMYCLKKITTFWLSPLFLVLFVLTNQSSISKAELVDGIAAVVNDKIITFTDLRNMLGPTEETLRKSYSPNDPLLMDRIKSARQEALDQLIERQLILQQFNERGGKIPDNYIEEEIKNVIQEQYGGDRSIFIKTIEALGMNLEAYKERMRDKIIVRYMQNHEIGNDNILISPYKIEKYYKEHQEEFKEGAMVKLRMVYIKKGDKQEEVEGARSLAQELLLKLTTGSDFKSIASVYSEGSEKNKGGELGFVAKETLREELREPAFSLMQDQISPVIETKDGFYILQVQEKKPVKIISTVEAREIIEQKLIRQEREQLQKKWVQALRRKAYIRLY
jgi:peptidyl-prolyl cis-trans isomerase SurA